MGFFIAKMPKSKNDLFENKTCRRCEFCLTFFKSLHTIRTSKLEHQAGFNIFGLFSHKCSCLGLKN